MFASHVNTFTNYLIGGWQVSPFLQLTSGSPFDITIAGSRTVGPSVRPNLVDKGNLHLHPTPANNYDILNPNDFAAPATNAGGFYTAPGNVHKNQFRGSNYSNLSMSVFKDFPIHGTVVAQLRGQFYNLLNSPAVRTAVGHAASCGWRTGSDKRYAVHVCQPELHQLLQPAADGNGFPSAVVRRSEGRARQRCRAFSR